MPAQCPVIVRAPRIYTSFRPTKFVEALTILGDYVVYAGNATEAARIGRDLARSISCGKPRLLEFDGVAAPGFVDAHLHIQGIGVYKHSIKLNDAESLDDLLRRVAEEADRFNEWVIGRGWDQDKLGTWPTRFDLDEVVRDKPVVLMRVCGHAAVLNTRAMEILGYLESDSPLIDKGCNGEPTGIVYEELAERAYHEAVRSLDALRLVVDGLNELAKNGITLAGAMDVEEHALRGLILAWHSGLMAPRLRVYLSRKLFEKLYSAGFVPSFGGPQFRIMGVKIYMDGSLGARTAWLRRPYSDDEKNSGKQLLASKEVYEIARKASEWRLDVAAHAIGDAAILEALRGYDMAGCRCRIEHASLAPRDVIDKLATLGVRVAVQPRFLISDWWAVERLGAERTRWLYPFRTMLSRGVILGFSSDAPVEPLNPLEGVYAAVTRGALLPHSKEEALDVETALYLYTGGAAQVLNEPRAGCLEPGCYGDVVVLSEDPLSTDIEDIPRISVTATLVGGELVWEKR